MKKDLTPEQETLMVEVRDEWINKLSRLPLVAERANASIDWLYSLINVGPPRKLHVSSPLAVQYAANMLKTLVDAKMI